MSNARSPVRNPDGTGTRRGRLYVPPGIMKPTHKYRYVKLDGMNLQNRIDDGWSVVPQSDFDAYNKKALGEQSSREGLSSDGSMITKVGGLNDNGSEYKLVLMYIPKALHEEIQLEKQKVVDEIDESLGRTSEVHGVGTSQKADFNN